MVNNSIKRSNSKLSFEAKFSFEQGDIKIQNQEKNLVNLSTSRWQNP